MEIKPAQMRAFLQSPTDNLRVILVYGPDRGMVGERVRQLVKYYAGSLDDAFNITRLNGSDISADNSALFDEYLSIPMFGGKKVIWLFDDATQIQKQMTTILNDDQDGNIIVIEGRDLKKTSAIVKLCIKHKLAASLPCYQDNEQDVAQLIRDIMAENNLKISVENIQYLQSLLGNDRMLSRSEIDKLVTYCYKKQEVTTEDIHICLNGDAAKFSFDKLIDAITGGQTKQADNELNHFLATGNHPVMIFAVIRNHFNMLHLASYKHKMGINVNSIIQSMRPPIFFNRKNIISSQIRRWSQNKCDLAQILIAEADIDSRMNATLSKNILNRLVTRLTLMANR